MQISLNGTRSSNTSSWIRRINRFWYNSTFSKSRFYCKKCYYYFKILRPGEKLSVVIDQYDKKGKILFASQDGIRSDLTSNQLLKSYLKHPLMTFKVITAIHFEAFKLWIKGIKFVKKKLKIKNNITVEN